MTVSKMAKWLRRDGWTVTKRDRLYCATKPNIEAKITYYPNGPDTPEATAVCIGVSSLDGTLQPTYCDSLAQAERLAER